MVLQIPSPLCVVGSPDDSHGSDGCGLKLSVGHISIPRRDLFIFFGIQTDSDARSASFPVDTYILGHSVLNPEGRAV